MNGWVDEWMNERIMDGFSLTSIQSSILPFILLQFGNRE